MTRRSTLRALTGAVSVALAYPAMSLAQRRRTVVVRRGPAQRTRVVVRPNHPIRRPLPPTVVVRPARVPVAVAASLVFLPAVAFAATVVSLPPRGRLVWEDTEVIQRDEEWVDCNFGVDQHGDELFLDIKGRAQISFAEVTFENGNVQVVDFNDRPHGNDIYRLLDFADGRKVKTVRVLARAVSDEARLTIYLKK